MILERNLGAIPRHPDEASLDKEARAEQLQAPQRGRRTQEDQFISASAQGRHVGIVYDTIFSHTADVWLSPLNKK